MKQCDYFTGVVLLIILSVVDAAPRYRRQSLFGGGAGSFNPLKSLLGGGGANLFGGAAKKGGIGSLLRLGDLVNLGSIDTQSVPAPDLTFDKIHELCRIMEMTTARLPTSAARASLDKGMRPSSFLKKSLFGKSPPISEFASKCNMLKMFSGVSLSDPSNLGGLIEGLAIAGNSGPAAPVTRFLTSPGLGSLVGGNDGGLQAQNLIENSLNTLAGFGGVGAPVETSNASNINGNSLTDISSLNSITNNMVSPFSGNSVAGQSRQNLLSQLPPEIRQQLTMNALSSSNQRPIASQRATTGTGNQSLQSLKTIADLAGSNAPPAITTFFSRLDSPGLGFASQGDDAGDLGSFLLRNFLPSPSELVNGADIMAPAQEAGTSFLNSFVQGLFQG